MKFAEQVGLQTLFVLKSLYRLLCLPVCRLLDRLLLRRVREWGRGLRAFSRDMGRGLRALRHGSLRGRRLPALRVVFKKVFSRHRHVLRRTLSAAGPIAAAAVLLVTVLYWSNQTYALSIQYDGKTIGYVTDESAINLAMMMVANRVVNVDNSLQMGQPRLLLGVAPKAAILDESTVCDRILMASGDKVAQMTGVFVSGHFQGAMLSADDVQAVLDGFKARYLTGAPEETAEFVQTVDVVDGMYPVSAGMTAAGLRLMLSRPSTAAQYYTVQAGDTFDSVAAGCGLTAASLQALNSQVSSLKPGMQLVVAQAQSMLQVRVTLISHYSQAVPFQALTQYDPARPVTYQGIQTKGVPGSEDVTARIVSIDGVEQANTVISATRTLAPVDQVTVVGTKTVLAPSGRAVVQGDGITTGQFIWPVPACHNVHQIFHPGHTGWDISSGPVPVLNTPALAADGGTVIYASRYYNYGNFVAIQHANGLVTRYAHLNYIDVVVGQRVSRGQQIGRIGSTGDSTGPHLHFEVMKNGVFVNPAGYLTAGSYR